MDVDVDVDLDGPSCVLAATAGRSLSGRSRRTSYPVFSLVGCDLLFLFRNPACLPTDRVVQTPVEANPQDPIPYEVHSIGAAVD